MQTLGQNETIPSWAVRVIIQNGVRTAYAADDELPIEIVSAEAKSAKIAELQAAYNEAVKTFTSAALGVINEYSADQQDQIHLMGAVLTGQDIQYKCKAAGEEVSTFKTHTAAQMQQAFGDGAAYKLAQMMKLEALSDQVAAVDPAVAGWQDQIEAIVW